MPPVAAAIGAAVGGLSAALGGGGLLAGTGLLAGLSGGGLGSIALKLASGVAMTALSRALTPTPGTGRTRPAGITSSIALGEDAPANIILGKFAVEMKGDNILWQGSASLDAGIRAPENAMLSVAVELCDFPTTLRRIMVNGEWATLGPTPHPDFGYPVTNYRYKGDDYLFVQFYDGTQIATDPYLLEKFGAYPDRPWTADMVGPGITWAVVTAGFSPEVWRGGFPKITFELNGIRLYDPRQDTEAGGSGSQRLDDQTSWSVAGSFRNSNLAVMAYNVMLGLRDPVTDEKIFGRGVPQRDLPNASWFAAMNACDADAVALDGGDEPAYRGGYEILLTDDVTPAAVVKDMLDGCQGQVAQVAGLWDVRVGAPGTSVYAFTDDDIEIYNHPEDFIPFAGIDEAFNGIAANYPEPEDGWRPREAPTRSDADYIAEDKGRKNVATLNFPAVPYAGQVQRLMEAALHDARRQRRHVLVLPPEAQALGPLDVIEWTSARNGYDGKLFEIDLVEPLPSECVRVTIREVDPSDYDFDEEQVLPSVVGFLGKPRRLPLPNNTIGFEPAVDIDDDNVTRRPAVLMTWDHGLVGLTGVRYRRRVKDQPNETPVLGGLNFSLEDKQADPLTIYEGTPVEIYEGEALASSFASDIEPGEHLITAGIVANVTYQFSGQYQSGGKDGPWGPWVDVTAPDVRISWDDIEDDIKQQVDDALEAAEDSAAESAAAFALASDALAAVEALTEGTIQDFLDLLDELGGLTVIADLEALLAELEGISPETIIEARLAGLRGIRGAMWNADPVFAEWADGDPGLPDFWTLTDVGSPTVTKTTGSYGSAIRVETGSGAIGSQVIADSGTAGQVPGADVAAEWVVVAGLATIAAGDPDAICFRAEWRETGGGYVRGRLVRGGTTTNNALGTLTQLGLAVDSSRQQGFEFLMRKPVASADRVRVLYHKQSSVSSVTDVTIHLLGVRKASDAEVEAGQAAINLAASIGTVNTTIIGISDAFAASQLAINARVDGVESNIATNYVTHSTLNSSQAAQNTSLTSSIRGLAAADALQQFYTKVQTDGQITTAIAASRTSIDAQIAGVEAQVTAEAAVRATNDNALAGRITTIEATTSGTIVVNGDFTTGDFTGWTLTPTNGAFVIDKGSDPAAAVLNAPKPKLVRMPANASVNGMLNNRTFAAKAGDIFSASMMFAAGGTISGIQLLLRLQFIDALGTQTGIETAEVAATTPVWARLDLRNITAPANTAFVRVVVIRRPGGSGNLYFTGVSGTMEGAGASARITTAEAATATNTTAIAQVDQRITTEKAATLAEVANVYSSKVDTASAIAGSANTINTRITGVEATVTAEAAARSSADGALAGRLNVVEAISDPGSIVVNGSFRTGDLTGWTMSGGTVDVLPKGGAGVVAQSSPAPFMVRFFANPSAAVTVINQRFDAKKGDVVHARLQYAVGGGTRDASFRVIVRFLDAAAATLASMNVGVTNAASSLWQDYATGASTAAPEGTAFVRVEVVRLSGGAGDLVITGIDARKQDPVAAARISEVAVVASDASTSIASLRTEINAAFGSSSAFVQETQSAVASMDLLASTWVMRQKAGAAVGVMEAVVFDTPTGPAISTLKIDYDYLLIEGRITARDLIIDDSDNKVPDSQIQDRRTWDPNLDQAASWAILPTPTPSMPGARSLGEVRYVGPRGTGTSGTATIWGKFFAVPAGRSLGCSFQASGDAGGAWQGSAQIQFVDASIAGISTVTVGTLSGTGSGLVTATPVTIAIPANAAMARWRWVVNRPLTTSVVRFFAPTVRVQSQAVEIADGAVTAEKVLVDTALTNKLQAIDAWIVRANIGVAEIDTLRIAGNAVTIPVSFSNNTVQTVDAATFTTLGTFTVTMSQPGNLIVIATAESGTSGTFGSTGWEYRLLIDGTVVFDVNGKALHDDKTLSGSRNVAAGARTIQVQARTNHTLSSIVKRRLSVVALGAMR